jgi:hypothetical protein
MAKNNSEIMEAHVNDWMNSGLTIRDFAHKIGVTKGKFSYWVSKVKASNNIPKQFPQFIDLGSVTDNMKLEDNSPQKASPQNPQIALTFPSGLVLKIYG